MDWCQCFGIKKKRSQSEESDRRTGSEDREQSDPDPSRELAELRASITGQQVVNNPNQHRTQQFTYLELLEATEHFRTDFFLGEGGFGKVYKGVLRTTNQVVAIKQLAPDSAQGFSEFVAEIVTLGSAEHPNLVKLIGYCTEINHPLLVYEFMPLGSLERRLLNLEPGEQPLDWGTRMRIALGVGLGLEYLHNKLQPPVIYRDLKCSNILLDENYNPKLSDFGLAKIGPQGGKTHLSTRVMGTKGYCAPEYLSTGQLTFKSDMYSFGVFLLVLITGRQVIDRSRPEKERDMVEWAKGLIRNRKFSTSQLADPGLRGQYPKKCLRFALHTAYLCVRRLSGQRPSIADVVETLRVLAAHRYEPHGDGASASHDGA